MRIIGNSYTGTLTSGKTTTAVRKEMGNQRHPATVPHFFIKAL